MTALSAWRSHLHSGTLSGRVLSGGLWTVASYGSSQVLRLAGNVVLARLLFPEAFGVMVLVNAVIQGLEMFSDVGTAASLVQSRRGEEPAFLRTAYTIKVLRGFLLWALAAALALPAAEVFGKPELLHLLPVAGASAAIAGLASNRLLLAHRALELRRVTLLRLGAQGLAIAVMVAWAWVRPSVWALVAGALVGSAATTLGSHLLLAGAPDRFGWERGAAREMFRFGRWIFASTALAYLAARGDVLLMGRMLSTTELGIYGIAITLAHMVGDALGQLVTNVLFPAYSRVVREAPAQLGHVLRRSRLTMLGVGAAAYAPFILLGGPIVDALYDERYAGAGWMLQTLGCGFAVGLVHRSYDGVLHAKGLSFLSTVLQGFQVAIKVLCFTLGYAWFGLPGFVVGLAFSSWIAYPALAVVMSRAGVWQPRLDARVLALAAAVTAAFLAWGPLGALA